MFTLDLASQMVSMSLEKFFSAEVLLFSLCSCRCLLLGLFFGFCLPSFCGAFQHSLWCGSAWFVVRIDLARWRLSMLWWLLLPSLRSGIGNAFSRCCPFFLFALGAGVTER
jgi:hypothetical protein